MRFVSAPVNGNHCGRNGGGSISAERNKPQGAAAADRGFLSKEAISVEEEEEREKDGAVRPSRRSSPNKWDTRNQLPRDSVCAEGIGRPIPPCMVLEEKRKARQRQSWLESGEKAG